MTRRATTTRYGADGPNRFDCSGLVYYAFRKAGFEHVPRTSSEQARHMNRIDRSDMRPGDFVFFYDGAATAENVYHVGDLLRLGGRPPDDHPLAELRRAGRHRSRSGTTSWFAGTLRGLG